MNPYKSLPQKAFWKPAVAEKSMFDISEIWQPKFNIKRGDGLVTFGSCFAQHLGRAMEARGYNWMRTETPPPHLSPENMKKFNYGIFSARTANIYTTSLLKQWTEWALADTPIPDEIWTKDERFIDPLRPLIEPNGFASEEELIKSRQETIRAFKEGIETAEFFVFTLGLTESWVNAEHGYEYPMCPGTVGGTFSPDLHRFENQMFSTILQNLSEAMGLMKKVNPSLRFILTVSPVPLTATMSGRHVAVATMASKSILRAVADQLATNRPYVDYFPSYEIINSPIFRGAFFEPNLRSVNPAGVSFVMDNFFKCLENVFGPPAPIGAAQNPQPAGKSLDDLVCEEELLGSFQNA